MDGPAGPRASRIVAGIIFSRKRGRTGTHELRRRADVRQASVDDTCDTGTYAAHRYVKGQEIQRNLQPLSVMRTDTNVAHTILVAGTLPLSAWLLTAYAPTVTGQAAMRLTVADVAACILRIRFYL